MRKGITILAIFLVLTITSCTSVSATQPIVFWANSGIDIRNAQVKWTIPEEKRQRLFDVTAGSTAVIVYEDLLMVGIDLAVGSRLWKATLPSALAGTDLSKTITYPLRWLTDDGLLFLGVESEVFCIDCVDGGLLWKEKLPGEICEPITVSADKLIVSTNECLTCFNKKSGQKLWQKETWVLAYTCCDDSIYCTEAHDESQTLSRRNLSDGKLIWSVDVTGDDYIYKLVAVCGEYVVFSQSCITDTESVEKLRCLRQSTGEQIWSKERATCLLWHFGDEERLILGPGLYFRENDEGEVEEVHLPIECIDVETGESYWTRDTEYNHEAEIFNTPYGILFYCYRDYGGGLALLMDPKSGKTEWAQRVLPHHRGGTSIWMQTVHCRIVGDKFIVDAEEPSGRYLEIFDVKTGNRPERLETRSKGW